MPSVRRALGYLAVSSANALSALAFWVRSASSVRLWTILPVSSKAMAYCSTPDEMRSIVEKIDRSALKNPISGVMVLPIGYE